VLIPLLGDHVGQRAGSEQATIDHLCGWVCDHRVRISVGVFELVPGSLDRDGVDRGGLDGEAVADLTVHVPRGLGAVELGLQHDGLDAQLAGEPASPVLIPDLLTYRA